MSITVKVNLESEKELAFYQTKSELELFFATQIFKFRHVFLPFLEVNLKIIAKHLEKLSFHHI